MVLLTVDLAEEMLQAADWDVVYEVVDDEGRVVAREYRSAEGNLSNSNAHALDSFNAILAELSTERDRLSGIEVPQTRT